MLLNFLTLDIKQPDRFGNHQRSLPPQESLGLVFHLKMLVFIKISNTNKMFPNQALLANRSCFCDILFISATKPLGYFTWYLISVSNLESECGPRARFSVLLFIKPTLLLHRIHKRSKPCKVFTLLLSKNIK